MRYSRHGRGKWMLLTPALGVLLEQLILPTDEHTRTELRKLLEGWLVERDSMLVPPVEEMVCAIITMPSSLPH